MTQTKSASIVPGFTRLVQQPYAGSTSVGPSGVIIQDTGGYDYYVWVDTAGKLRITDATTAEAAGFNWLTGGTVVGSQS